MTWLGAFSTLPELQGNSIRIDALRLMASVVATGTRHVSGHQLFLWLRDDFSATVVERMEDPPEDVFVDVIVTSAGSFRVFPGNFADAAFQTQQLLEVIDEKCPVPQLRAAKRAALELLRLSDYLVERRRLFRYCQGEVSGFESNRVLNETELDLAKESVIFTKNELTEIGINTDLIACYVCDIDESPAKYEQVLWNSSIDEKPLIPQIASGGGVIIAAPSSICRAICLTLMRVLGKGGALLDQMIAQRNATQLVQHVTAGFRVHPMTVELPPHPQSLPTFWPFVGFFDFGRPVIVFTWTPSVDPGADGLNASMRLTSEQESVLEGWMVECCRVLEKEEGFLNGLILFGIASPGYMTVVRTPNCGHDWEVVVAPLADLIILSTRVGADAMRLWKAKKQERFAIEHGVEYLNASGFLNFYAWWERSGYSALPHEINVTTGRKLLLISPDECKAIRIQEKRRWDRHCIRSHDGDRWITLLRHSRSINPDITGFQTYRAEDQCSMRQLLGCSKRTKCVFWIVTDSPPPSVLHRKLAFQLWECIYSWLDKIGWIAAESIGLGYWESIMVELVLPEFPDWHIDEPRAVGTLQESVDRDRGIIRLTLEEGFLYEFNQEGNVAERAIIKAILRGIAVVTENQLSDDYLSRLVDEVSPSHHERYFHFVRTDSLERALGDSLPDPNFLQEEDRNLCTFGLCQEVLKLEPGVVEERQRALNTLKKAVTEVWSRIEERLADIDHTSVVSCCLEQLDSLVAHEAKWTFAARALSSLPEDRDFLSDVLKQQLSNVAIATLGNRLIIETAQYACKLTSGRRMSLADHSAMLADFECLLAFAAFRSAIEANMLKPRIHLFANGQVVVENEELARLVEPYIDKRRDDQIDAEVRDYSRYFDQRTSGTEGDDGRFRDFLRAFEREFGFTFERYASLVGYFAELAKAVGKAGGCLGLEEMRDLLLRDGKANPREVAAMIERLSLPLRSGWDMEIPEPLGKADVYPWRFRRGLSLYMRPLVEVRSEVRTLVISATQLRRSMEYLFSFVFSGVLPQEHFRSQEMKEFLGKASRARGERFAKKVEKEFLRFGFSARTSVKMWDLGATIKPDLGDVDVLAWTHTEKKVFLVECKSLVPAITVGEIVQRLREFAGDALVNDELAKHRRRVEWLKDNPDAIEKLCGIRREEMEWVPVVITSERMPMQFVSHRVFPSEQFLHFGGLEELLAR